jgi:hypothetical protein
MGEEKIFKDLTKKYAELAKKIHSKDKKSSSLIKGCSKRIALLDKLRVLEVSYLKCLKNKIKRGQKGGGGEGEEDEDERKQQDAVNQQEATGIINKALDEAGTVNGNKERALDVCTKALKKSMDLKDDVKNFIEQKMDVISNIYESIDTNDARARFLELREELANKANITVEKANNKLQEVIEQLKNKTGIDTDAAYEKSINLRDRATDKIMPMVSGVKKYGINFVKNLTDRINTNNTSSQPSTSSTGGSKKTTYRLNGEKVVLLYKNKKVQRSIYVKGNGKTKYCKIDHQYILLSKLKNKIQ